MLAIQRNGMGPPYFNGVGFGDAAGVTALQQALSNLSQVTQDGKYNPLRLDGVLDSQTLSAIAQAALNLNVPVLKTFFQPLKDLSLPIVGSVANALTNPFAIDAVETAYPGKVQAIKDWISANASKITLGLNAVVAVVGVPGGSPPPPAYGGGGGITIKSVSAAPGLFSPKGAIQSYFGGKWHIAVPRSAGVSGAGFGIPIYNAGTGLGTPVYNAGTGLGIPIYNAGTGLTGGHLGADPTHVETQTTPAQQAGTPVVDKKTYQDRVYEWYKKPLTIGLGTAALVGGGVLVWLLVR